MASIDYSEDEAAQVQVEIERSARQAMSRYPISTSLLQSDLIPILDCLSIGRPTMTWSTESNGVTECIPDERLLSEPSWLPADAHRLIQHHLNEAVDLQFKLSVPVRQVAVDHPHDHDDDDDDGDDDDNDKDNDNDRDRDRDRDLGHHHDYQHHSNTHTDAQLLPSPPSHFQPQPSPQHFYNSVLASSNSFHPQSHHFESPVKFNPVQLSSPSPLTQLKAGSESPDPLALPSLRTSTMLKKHPFDQESTPQSNKKPRFMAPIDPLETPRQTLSPAKVPSLPSSAYPQLNLAKNVLSHPAAESPFAKNSTARLSTLVEDILEAEDMRQEGDKSPSEIFHHTSTTEPILNPKVISKLTKFIHQSKGQCLLEIDIDDLSRLIKILERGLKVFEEAVVIPVQLKTNIMNNNNNNKKLAPSFSSSTTTLSATPKSSSKLFNSKHSSSSTPRNNTRKRAHQSESKPTPCSTSTVHFEDSVEPSITSSPHSSSSKRKSQRPEEDHFGSHQPNENCESENIPPTSSSFSTDEIDQTIIIIEERIHNLTVAIESVNFLCGIFNCGHKIIPKRFYSEDSILAIVKGLKYHLQALVYPSLLACGQIQKENTEVYLTRLQHIISKSNFIRQSILSAFTVISTSILPKIDWLVTNIELSESILNNLTYVAISPFLIEFSSTSRGLLPTPSLSSSTRSTKKQNDQAGRGGMVALRLECLKLLRNISSKYPAQRDWIVDEVLGSIMTLSQSSSSSGGIGSSAKYHLSNGKSIQTISALLLHIIQCCAFGTRASLLSKLSSSSPQVEEEQTTVARQEDSEPPANLEGKVYQLAKETVEPAFFTATKLGRKIVMYLLQKSGKSKGSTSNQAIYRTVYGQLIEDSINLLFLPDWPVAEFMLGLCCKAMMNILEEPKSSADLNVLKGLCIDHIGQITTRLFHPHHHDHSTVEISSPKPEKPAFVSFKTMISTGSRTGLSEFFKSQRSLLVHLETLSCTEDSTKNAIDFLHAQWTVELVKAIKSLKKAEGTDEQMATTDHDVKLCDFLENELKLFYNLDSTIPNTGIFSPGKRDSVPADVISGSAAESIAEVQGIKGIRDLLIDRIVASSASPIVSFRSKAIKALSVVVAQDETIFYRESVRTAIEHRMLDSSPAVRDAVMELIGKYVAVKPQLAITFLPQISARIADKGLSVRKRVVKLLKSIYQILDDDRLDLKVEVSQRLMSRMNDEESAMKDLTIDVLGELWFKNQEGLFKVHPIATIMMQVTAHSRDSTCTLEEVVKSIFKKHGRLGEVHVKKLSESCGAIVDHLVDEMMEAGSGARDKFFTEVDCLKTIHALMSVSARVLSPSRAMDLFPFLASAATTGEHAVMMYLLKLLKACAVDVPRSAKGFTDTLQAALLRLLNKPSLAAGGLVLQELVGCLCALVIHQTHDYQILIGVFKACERKLGRELSELGSTTIDLKTVVPVLMYVVSLVTGYGQLDELAVGNEYIRNELKEFSPLPLYMHVYQVMLEIFHNPCALSIRQVTLSCLGFLYQSYPTLMTEKRSTEMMDYVFGECQLELQYRLLKIIADFLTSQTDKAGEEDEKEVASTAVDMDQLIGNTENFADSGVGLAIVQRYLSPITTFAQSTQGAMQKTAVDIIGFTIKQGLAHPIACVPVLVALESSTDASLASRVFALHTLLHTKRPQLVHTRFLETMKDVYEFHARPSTGTSVSGHVGAPPRSVLAPWYRLLSQKRVWRLELLRTLVKSFAVDPLSQFHTQKTIDFNRYLADALVTLEYKTQEEVATVVKGLSTVVGGYAYQALHVVEEEEHEVGSRLSTLRACNVLGIGLVLRDRLKILYGLSDLKCAKFGSNGIVKKSKIGDSLAIRKQEVEDFDVVWTQELESKIPGLRGGSEQEQIEGFKELVRLDVGLSGDVEEDADEEERSN